MWGYGPFNPKINIHPICQLSLAQTVLKSVHLEILLFPSVKNQEKELEKNRTALKKNSL